MEEKLGIVTEGGISLPLGHKRGVVSSEVLTAGMLSCRPQPVNGHCPQASAVTGIQVNKYLQVSGWE